MAETPIYKFPSPTDSDDPDGPVQIKALAEAVEDAVWLPPNLATIATVSAASSMAKPATTVQRMGAGTGTIKTIAAGVNGQMLTIVFAASVKVENATGNVVLAQTGNFSAVSGEVLTLVYNETASAWVEVSRSTPRWPIGGLVTASAVITGGSGFTAEKTATGKIKITLDAEAATTLVPMAICNALSFIICNVAGIGKKSFEVETRQMQETGIPVLFSAPFAFQVKPS